MTSENENKWPFFQRPSVKQYKEQNELISNSFYIAAFRYTNELSSRVHCYKLH